MQVIDQDKVVYEHDGYVPGFMPGEHYGDYIELDIDVKTGKILNWTATATKVKAYIRTNRERA